MKILLNIRNEQVHENLANTQLSLSYPKRVVVRDSSHILNIGHSLEGACVY